MYDSDDTTMNFHRVLFPKRWPVSAFEMMKTKKIKEIISITVFLAEWTLTSS